MISGRERFNGNGHFEAIPTSAEICLLHKYLTAPELFFINKETALLLEPKDVSRVLEVALSRKDVGEVILGDLIAREQIRFCSNLPGIYEGLKGISFLSILEYVVKKQGGKISKDGEFSKEIDQVDLQKKLIGEILSMIPNWRRGLRDHVMASSDAFTTLSKSIATLTGPTPPGLGV